MSRVSLQSHDRSEGVLNLEYIQVITGFVYMYSIYKPDVVRSLSTTQASTRKSGA